MPARTLGVVLALALLAPASAAAQSRTFGSPLTADPNVSLGCETKLALGDDGGTGTFYASPSNQPDCTWRQQGVFGVTDFNQDTRFSSVPATGRIINIRVKSGPNPGLIRFVILRELLCPSTTCNQGGTGGQDGSTGGSYCCYFENEGPIVRPNPPGPGNPNGITDFPTNFLVVRNVDNNGVLAVDHVAISGVSGTGSLPLHSTGRNNAFQYTEPGSVNASFWYPRMGALPSDRGPQGGAGRREEGGVPGIEILMQWTWCPAGQTCAGAAPPPIPGAGPAQVSRFGLFPLSFFPALRGASIAGRTPVGTTIRYTLDRAARVRFTVERPAPGRRLANRRCVAPNRANRLRPRCTRYVAVRGSFSHSGSAGVNRFRFTGRIGGRRLAPGSYRLVVTPPAVGRTRGVVRRIPFRIKR
jgi:hypothetical protein